MGVNCKMDPYFPQQMHVLAGMILYLCSSMSVFRSLARPKPVTQQLPHIETDGVLYSTLSLFDSNAAQSDCTSGKRGMADDTISAN